MIEIDFCGDCGSSFRKTSEFAKHLPICKKRGPMCYIWQNNFKHPKPCRRSLCSKEFNEDFTQWESRNIEFDIDDSQLEEIDKVRGSKTREEWIKEAIETYTDMLST